MIVNEAPPMVPLVVDLKAVAGDPPVSALT